MDDVVIKKGKDKTEHKPKPSPPPIDVIFARFKEAYRKIATRDGEWAAHNIWQYITFENALNGGSFEDAVKTLEAIGK